MLHSALNKGNKPPIIADKIEVVELEMGTQVCTVFHQLFYILLKLFHCSITFSSIVVQFFALHDLRSTSLI
jgi:hypothetical protein